MKNSNNQNCPYCLAQNSIDAPICEFCGEELISISDSIELKKLNKFKNIFIKCNNRSLDAVGNSYNTFMEAKRIWEQNFGSIPRNVEITLNDMINDGVIHPELQSQIETELQSMHIDATQMPASMIETNPAENEQSSLKKCPFCLSDIPIEAQKCHYCKEWMLDTPKNLLSINSKIVQKTTPGTTIPTNIESLMSNALLNDLYSGIFIKCNNRSLDAVGNSYNTFMEVKRIWEQNFGSIPRNVEITLNDMINDGVIHPELQSQIETELQSMHIDATQMPTSTVEGILQKNNQPSVKKCQFCLSDIPMEALKCYSCGEWIAKAKDHQIKPIILIDNSICTTNIRRNIPSYFSSKTLKTGMVVIIILATLMIISSFTNSTSNKLDEAQSHELQNLRKDLKNQPGSHSIDGKLIELFKQETDRQKQQLLSEEAAKKK